MKGKECKHIYRSSQFRDGGLVGERATITRIWHQDTRKKHGTQVISVQNVHREGGGGGSPLIQILCTVLWKRGKKRNTKNNEMDPTFPSAWLDCRQVSSRLQALTSLGAFTLENLQLYILSLPFELAIFLQLELLPVLWSSTPAQGRGSHPFEMQSPKKTEPHLPVSVGGQESNMHRRLPPSCDTISHPSSTTQFHFSFKKAN